VNKRSIADKSSPSQGLFDFLLALQQAAMPAAKK